MMTEQPTIKLANIIEAALLASDKPINLDQIRQLFPDKAAPSKEDIQQALTDIEVACEGRGFELKQVASGYRFQIRQEMAPWVGKLWEEKPRRYTRALLETLALVAYRQPVTRAEIEEVRGVSVSSSIIKTLLEREWVRIVGYRDVPGRPAMYATTRQFLDYFNLTNLDDLPPLSDIQDIEKANQELVFDDNETEPTTELDRVAASTTDADSKLSANESEAETEQVDDETLFREIDAMQKDLPEDFIDPAKKVDVEDVTNSDEDQLVDTPLALKENELESVDERAQLEALRVPDQGIQAQVALAEEENTDTTAKISEHLPIAESEELSLQGLSSLFDRDDTEADANEAGEHSKKELCVENTEQTETVDADNEQVNDEFDSKDHTAADVLATELLTRSAETVIPSIFPDDAESDKPQVDESSPAASNSDIQLDS